MDLRAYVRLLLRRWLVFVIAAVLIFAFIGGASFLIPSVYTSTAKAVVSARIDSTEDIEQRRVAATYVLERMTTYAQAVATERVLAPVVASLDLDATVDELADEIVVTIPTSTAVLAVTASAPSAELAAAIANHVVAELPAAVASLEGADSPVLSPVQVTVLEAATPPESRSSPNIRLNLLVAVILALFIGVLTAAIVDNFDTRVRRAKDVTALGVGYLGGVETVRDADVDLLLFTAASPERMAVYRRIAIDTLFLAESSPTHLLFSSVRPGAGKTTVAANIAGALAEAGNRVVYVDLDVRGGRLAAHVGVPQSRGITDVVTGRASLGDVLFYWKPGGFTLLPCGGSAVDVSELLAGERFEAALRELDELFDVVIIDAPPMANASDAARFTQNIPTVVLVAEAIDTTRAELLRAAAALRQAGARLLGVVLSRVTRMEQAAAPEEDQEPPASVEAAPREQ